MTQISTIREIQSWSIDFNGLEKVLAEYCKEQKIDLAVSGRSLKSRFLLLLEEIATDKKEYETFVQYYKSTENGQYIFNIRNDLVNKEYGVEVPGPEDKKKAALMMYDILLQFERVKKGDIPQEYNDLKYNLISLIPYSIPPIYDQGTGVEEIKKHILEKADNEFLKKTENMTAAEFIKMYICAERDKKQTIIKGKFEDYYADCIEKKGIAYFEKKLLPKVECRSVKKIRELHEIMFTTLNKKCGRYKNMMDEFLRFRVAERHVFCCANGIKDKKFISTGEMAKKNYLQSNKEYDFEYLLKIFSGMKAEIKDRAVTDFKQDCVDVVMQCINHPLKKVSKKDYDKIMIDLFGELEEWGVCLQKKVNLIFTLESYQKLRNIQIEERIAASDIVEMFEEILSADNNYQIEIENLLKMFGNH